MSRRGGERSNPNYRKSKLEEGERLKLALERLERIREICEPYDNVSQSGTR